MKAWEEAGMTRDEYDKAMAEMDEVLGGGASFEQQPFDKMLDFRHNWGDEWSKRDNKLMNQKILDEWKAIQKKAYEGAMKSEEMAASIDSYEYRREQDGINGDESDIPWYEARDHGFGKSREELEQEAADYGEKVGRQYEESRDELFERVYETDRQFDRYDGGVTSATYKELGDEYEKFYRDKIADYAESKMKAFSGIDLSRSASSPQSEASAAYTKDDVRKTPERIVQRQVPEHFNEMLNSVEHGVSNPDYDFDEKD